MQNITSRRIPPRFPLLFFITIVCQCAVPVAQAQTILTGHHDNNNGYRGYGPGTYIVPADPDANTPSATFDYDGTAGLFVRDNAVVSISGGEFNNNEPYGLYVYNNSQGFIQGGVFKNNDVSDVVIEQSSSVVVSGGLFSGSNFDGLLISTSSTATVSDGMFAANGYGLASFNGSRVTVNGGQFTNNSVGLYAETNSNIIVTGGSFSNKAEDFDLFNATSTMDIYGAFDGLSIGQTRILTATGTRQSFTGQLQFGNAPQVFTYYGGSIYGPGGTITLHDVALAAAPEPSSVAALAVGILGLGALALRARKRTAARKAVAPYRTLPG